MYYLYISFPDKISAPGNEGIGLYDDETPIVAINDEINLPVFGHDEIINIINKQKIYDDLGYHTMLYRTAGRSDARLSNVLLNYPMETISITAFNEATHRHIHSFTTHMPYIFEEACADVVGNHATVEFAKNNNGFFSLHSAKNQLQCMENIDKCINSYSAKYEMHEYILQDYIYKNCHEEILEYLPKNNRFFWDRYDYYVNNAYFLRFRDYTFFYFLLNKALHKMGLKEFISFIKLIPPNAQDAEELLKVVCR